MNSVLFQHVVILDPHSLWDGKQADVLVKDGFIEKIASAGTINLSQSDIAITKGGYLSPGWVDMRCQLNDPGYEQRPQAGRCVLSLHLIARYAAILAWHADAQTPGRVRA